MSIYIKGMKLPESCGMCDTQGLKNAIWHFGFGCDGDIDDFANCPPASCPLVPVPEHGRLIEADAAKELMKPVDSIREYEPEWSWGELYESYCKGLDSLPTIITADKE